MKRALKIFLLSIIFISSVQPFIHAQNDYEKYGKIATVVVKEDYPGEEVVEYQYMGREKINDQEVADKFRFEVLENGKKKFVIVTVKHNLQNNKMLDLTVQEE